MQSILTMNLWGKIAGRNDGYCSNTDFGTIHEPQEFWHDTEVNQV